MLEVQETTGKQEVRASIRLTRHAGEGNAPPISPLAAAAVVALRPELCRPLQEAPARRRTRHRHAHQDHQMQPLLPGGVRGQPGSVQPYRGAGKDNTFKKGMQRQWEARDDVTVTSSVASF